MCLLSLPASVPVVPVRDAGRFAAAAGGLGNRAAARPDALLQDYLFHIWSGLGRLRAAAGSASLDHAAVGAGGHRAGVARPFALLFHIDPRAYLADIYAAGQRQALGMREHLLVRYALSNSDITYLALVCCSSSPGRRRAMRP